MFTVVEALALSVRNDAAGLKEVRSEVCNAEKIRETFSSQRRSYRCGRTAAAPSPERVQDL